MMPGLDEMVEPRVSGGNPLTDLYASGNLAMEQPSELEKWHAARQPGPPHDLSWRDALGEALSLGMMAMGSRFSAPTAGVSPPTVKSFNPNFVKNSEQIIRQGPVGENFNSNYRALAPLRPQEQLEFERVSHAKGQQVLSGKYTDPYDAAALRTKEQRLQELRDLIMVRQRAKKLGIDVVDFIHQEMAKLPKE